MTTATKTKPSKPFAGKTAGPIINSAAWRKQQLDEAIENVAYWKRRAAIATNLTQKADASARVEIWKTTRDARAQAVAIHNR